MDSGYAANNVTKTEITVNASEYRKEFKKPRQIISFSNTLRYASNVQSLILKLNPWLFKTVGSIKDASTTQIIGIAIERTNKPRMVNPIPRITLSVLEYFFFFIFNTFFTFLFFCYTYKNQISSSYNLHHIKRKLYFYQKFF